MADEIAKESGGTDRVILTNNYEGENLVCLTCGRHLKKGDRVYWTRGVKGVSHVMCSDSEKAAGLRERLAPSRAVDADIDVPSPPGWTYMPFQRGGIAFATNLFVRGKPGVLIADQMGLGKTIQAIGIMNAHPQMRRVIIVCPASLRVNWREELEKWLVRPHVIHVAKSGDSIATDDDEFDDQVVAEGGGTKPLFEGELRVYVVSYNLLATMHKEHPDLYEKMKWDLLVFDEAHCVKNEKSQRTQAVRAVGRLSEKRIALTGTPIPNAVQELFPILSILDPHEWDPPGVVKQGDKRVKVGFGEGAGFFQFAKTYAGAVRRCVIHKDPRVCAAVPHTCRLHWEFGGKSGNLDALQEKLRTTIMVRRMKRDVLTELPPKVRQVRKLPVDGFGNIIKKEKAEWRELGMDPEMALEMGEPIPFEKMSEVRKALALMKVPHVVEICEEALESNDKIIVFAHHREVLETLHGELSKYGSVILYGGQGDFTKNAAVRSFQDDPKTRVFCGGITAAGVGLTLTASSCVIFGEESYVPFHVDQSEDRAHRIGQKGSVLVIHPVVDKSLDARMVELIVAKQEIADLALDTGLLDEKGNRIDETPERARERELREVKLTEADVAAIQEDLVHWATAEKFSPAMRDTGRMLAKLPRLSPHQAKKAQEIMGRKAA